MSQPQSGWYPDPADPARHRYWSGDAWTANTRSTQPVTPATPDPFASYYSAVPVAPIGAMPAAGAWTPPSNGPTTADGVPLSGWWWRVLASLLDGLALGLVLVIILMAVPSLTVGYRAYLADIVNAGMGAPGSAILPWPTDPTYHIAAEMAIISGIELVLTAVYTFAMLRFVGATLGQLACGLRVVPVDQGRAKPGLAAGSILLRLAFYSWLPAIGSYLNVVTSYGVVAVPGLTALGFVASLYVLLDVLWALWDPKRQCLHDKVSRTQLVRPQG